MVVGGSWSARIRCFVGKENTFTPVCVRVREREIYKDSERAGERMMCFVGKEK